jgi:hypothetical protein
MVFDTAVKAVILRPKPKSKRRGSTAKVSSRVKSLTHHSRRHSTAVDGADAHHKCVLM